MRRLAYAMVFVLVIGLAAGVFTRTRTPSGKSLLIGVAQAMEAARSIHVIAHGNRADSTSPSGMRFDPEPDEMWESVDDHGVVRRDLQGGVLSTSGISLDGEVMWMYDSRSGLWYIADLTPVFSVAAEVVQLRARQGLRGEAPRVPYGLADVHESVHMETREGREIAVITYTGINNGGERPLAERHVFEVDMATNHLLNSRRYVQAPGSEEQLLESVDHVDYNVPVPTDAPEKEHATVVRATVRAEENAEDLSLVLYVDGKEILRSDAPK